jgi:hypothetical protein
VRWKKLDDYSLESDSGYRVSKSFRPQGPVYAAWAPRGDRSETVKALVYSPELTVCIAACEKHLENAGIS